MNKPLEAEIVPEVPQMAVAMRQQGGAVGRAMTIDELHENLEFIRQVMAREMSEGQDYGKVPGCGEKPGLFQPGAQKLLMTFQLTDHVKKEEVRDIPGKVAGHREYAFTVSVKSQTGREWDGVGTCSTMEAKYRFRGGQRKCPKCGKETIIKGKAEYGGGWLCFQKKGGCGAKWPDGATEIEAQSVEKVEHDNPADYWNTVRKMAFKRALVHAAINATNTSELWSQDLEDLPQAGQADFELPTQPTPPPSQSKSSKPAAKTAAKPQSKEDNTPLVAEFRKLIGRMEPEVLRFIRSEPTKSGKHLLMPNEGLEDLPASTLRALINNWNEMYPRIEAWLAEHPAAANEKPEDPDSDDAPWRSFPMPWGKEAGTKLADLDKKYLYGLWANYKVETEYDGKPKKPETIAKEQELRGMLDQAGEHYGFTKKD